MASQPKDKWKPASTEQRMAAVWQLMASVVQLTGTQNREYPARVQDSRSAVAIKAEEFFPHPVRYLERGSRGSEFSFETPIHKMGRSPRKADLVRLRRPSPRSPISPTVKASEVADKTT